ncbi:hypothetical protein QBC45DRAFT_473276 [Copromyces sp. CBS 386.78]|nr:hypothetical protein QBC45DRAFT_473276 [Copromyces sp. CBS 386.78]
MVTTRNTTKGSRASIRTGSRKTEKTAHISKRRLIAMTAPPPSFSSSLSSRTEATNNSAAVDSASDHDTATHADNVTADVEQKAEETSSDDNRWKSNTGGAKRWRLAQRRLSERAAQQKAERQTPEEAAREASVRQAQQHIAAENRLRRMHAFWKTQPEAKLVDRKDL